MTFGEQYRNHATGCTDEYDHPGACRFDDGQPRASKIAADLAAELPTCEDDDEGTDLISLCDIVITAIEHDEFRHFHLHKYAPRATGTVGDEWAVIRPLAAAEKGSQPVRLTVDVMRKAVAAYIDSRLVRGMSYDEVRQLVDGSYTDLEVADSIIQFALYGEELFS